MMSIDMRGEGEPEQVQDADNETVTLNSARLRMQTGAVLVGAGLCALWAFALARMTSAELQSTTAKWFIAYVAFWSANLARVTLQLIETRQHLGKSFSKQEWFEMTLSSRFPFNFLGCGGLGCYICGCYMLSLFTPISSNNCPGFETSASPVCAALQVITVITWIMVGLLGLLVVVYVFAGTCFCCLLACTGQQHGTALRKLNSQIAAIFIPDAILYASSSPASQ
jgi:hypothetical protein